MTASELMESLRTWAPLAIAALSAGWAWLAFVARREFASTASLEALAEADRAVALRLALVEQRLQHLPTDAEIERLRTSFEHMREEQRGIKAAIGRIEEFLMKGRSP